MKISVKLTLLAILPVAVALAASFTTLLIQQRRLSRQVEITIRQQAYSEAGKIAQSVYWLCVSTESRNQNRLTHNLSVAHDILQQAGGIRIAGETVSWQAVNQFTKQVVPVTLPQMFAGSNWLGQVATTNERALIVDEAKRLTRDFCTVFQRMNDAGDMLRVCTSVLKDDGTRALGTFIPARNPDGADNPVVQAVLRGETYRGRAFVVNQWHATAYEPIWDSGKTRVIGMLYIGIGLDRINRELHDAITQMVVGKTGYVFVLGGGGDERGKYIVSQNAKRDGENIWESKDATGRLFVQSLIEKGLKAQGGAVDYETYLWKNPGDASARVKFAAITSYAPWNWVIGAGAYEEDFNDVRTQLDRAQTLMLTWVGLSAGVVALLALVAGILFSRRIAQSISRVIARLSESSAQITAAAGHLTGSSQFLAEGASEQAAAIEETSSSLEEMASMTRRNAENARAANELARQARTAADQGAADMGAMSTAMDGIKNSSDDIAKIIKTIDEIAFQTNILALNAAVEAARAGEAGMGFAVVAGEVRNLAQRSAQAARETSAKIEGAIAKTSQGVKLNGQVATVLNDIVGKSRQVDELVAEVANASAEQTQGIAQINTAVGQVDKVTQSNAANAEESAAAAEELNSQAGLMKVAVAELEKLVGGHVTGTDHNDSAGEVQHPSARAVLTQVPASGRGSTCRSAPAGPGAAAIPPVPPGRRSGLPLEGRFKGS